MPRWLPWRGYSFPRDGHGERGTNRVSLDDLRHCYDRGIRYVTLAHSRANQLSDSSFDANRPWGGLSPLGREVVTEMNRLGVMVDVSHLSDEAYQDVMEASTAPVIASHSSCRHFTPGYERNMSDAMIRALAANGGVIGINFGSLSGRDRPARFQGKVLSGDAPAV